MTIPLGITKRSSLNLGWGKCSVWLVDQWVPPSLCAYVCLSFDSTLRALIWLSLLHVQLLCSFEAWTYWLYCLILLIVLTYWLSLLYDYFAHSDSYIIIVHWLYWHVDYIDCFSYLLMPSGFSCCIIILLSLTCIFSFLCILFILVWLILFIVYYLIYLNILFILVIYLSCLSYSCLACV